MKTNISWCAMVLGALGAAQAQGQGAAISAGQMLAVVQPSDVTTQELLRQKERQRVQREQQGAEPDVRLERAQGAPAKLPENESPCFPIDHIFLQGQAAEQFQWALSAINFEADGVSDAALGRCLGAQGIGLVVKRIQNAIVAAGYVTTRVVAGEQDLRGGMLVLTLVPGRVRAIRLSQDSDANRANTWTATPAQSGELLNLRDLEQTLENFKRVPSAEADIQIVPAESPDAQAGESDLVITYRQNFPLRVSFAVDDAGAKATGKYQGSVTLSYDNPFALNDLLYFSYNQDLSGGDSSQRGTFGATVHYSVPLGYWLLGFTTSRSRYRQAVAGLNQTYVYSGQSSNSEIKLSRLVHRDAVSKTTVSMSGWQRTSKNFIDDTEVEVQRRRMAGLEFGVAHRQFIGASILEANVNYRRGTGALGALPAPEEAFGEGTSRSKIITANATLTAPFKVADAQLRYIANWRIQSNRSPLVPQDRFAIGGRYTVRGFDGENLLSAERGWFIRNDLGYTVGDSGQELYLGLDYGQVGGPSSDFLAGKHLAGAVLGLRGSIKDLSYDVFWGRPIAKAEAFQTSKSVAGVNMNWGF